MALLLLTVVRGDLLRNWRASLPPDAPNQFLVNVLPDQVDGVRARCRPSPARERRCIRWCAVGWSRSTATRFDTARFDDPRARRLAEREFNLSWIAALPPTNRIVAGAFWPAGRRHRRRLVARGGHREVAAAQARRHADVRHRRHAAVTATMTSLRKVDWDSFQPELLRAVRARRARRAADHVPRRGARSAGRRRARRGCRRWSRAIPNVLAIDVGE